MPQLLRTAQQFSFDPNSHPFQRVVADALGLSDLVDIHTLNGVSALGGQETASGESSAQNKAHDILYEKAAPQLQPLYDRFVQDVIRPIVQEDGEQIGLLYQARPSLRVCLPGGVGVWTMHKDSDYGHPSEEINFWLPLTNVRGHMAFQYESSPGRGDLKWLEIDYGFCFHFWGSMCLHGNTPQYPNTSGQSRVSLDFRVLPLSEYTPELASRSVGTARSNVPKDQTFSVGSYYSEIKF